jgi:hypothetical protein
MRMNQAIWSGYRAAGFDQDDVDGVGPAIHRQKMLPRRSSDDAETVAGCFAVRRVECDAERGAAGLAQHEGRARAAEWMEPRAVGGQGIRSMEARSRSLSRGSRYRL